MSSSCVQEDSKTISDEELMKKHAPDAVTHGMKELDKTINQQLKIWETLPSLYNKYGCIMCGCDRNPTLVKKSLGHACSQCIVYTLIDVSRDQLGNERKKADNKTLMKIFIGNMKELWPKLRIAQQLGIKWYYTNGSEQHKILALLRKR